MRYQGVETEAEGSNRLALTHATAKMFTLGVGGNGRNGSA
jgi:hypothetical protein